MWINNQEVVAIEEYRALEERLAALTAALQQLPAMIEGFIPLVVMEPIEEFIDKALAAARGERKHR